MNFALTPTTEKRLLIVLLATFAVAAAIYSVLTPLFEMSDELWHYPMVKTLADGNGLPIQDPAHPGPWKQEGSQPPLYYYLAAAATTWIDTCDVGEVLRPNPHVDNGIITPDGNNNLVVHNYKREAWPWYGTVLAVHLARFLSVIFGMVAIYFTYRIGLEIFPQRRWLAFAGAAVMAFTPMFAFISGAVNNDSLSVMLAAAALWIMMTIVRKGEDKVPTLRFSVALGITLGLAVLTKTSTLGLFGLAGISLAYAAWKSKRWQTLFVEGPLIIVLATVIAGWWYYRNIQLYGDPLGLSAFIAILGQRARLASLTQLWGERFGFMQSYWGLFGGVNIPMPDWVYTILNCLAVISVMGIILALALRLRHDGLSLSKWMPALLSLFWIAGVVLPLALSWARVTWSSQGRLVFAAISCISLWFTAGLSEPLPNRLAPIMAGSIVGGMAILTFLSPFVWIAPSYALPSPSVETDSGHSIDFKDKSSSHPLMRLLSYQVSPSATNPGREVVVKATWESLGQMDRDWSIFIHLEDSANFIAGQRDMYPGQGLIATSDIDPGFKWSDTYVIPISATAYAPENLSVRVGLYDYASCVTGCKRMQTEDGKDSVVLDTILLNPNTDANDTPNPVHFDFGGELALVGYKLDTRTVSAGNPFTVDLYWRGLAKMSQNYTVSIQLLGPETRIFAQKDSWPQDGELPTSTWIPNSLVEDSYTLTVNPDTPAGVYDLQVVVYSTDNDGTINKLQLVTQDNRLVDDFVLLTKLRVIP